MVANAAQRRLGCSLAVLSGGSVARVVLPVTSGGGAQAADSDSDAVTNGDSDVEAMRWPAATRTW